MTQELDVQGGSAVPALAYDPSTEIGTEDLALPKVKIGQYMTGHVQEDAVKAGSIFTELSSDDPDPVTLATLGDEITFYVLGVRKGWSHSEEGGDLETWAYDDPNRHEDAWRTYTYLVAIPDSDEQLPYKLLLTRTGAPAAKQINTMLKVNAAERPGHEVPFILSAVKRENDKGKFFVPRVKQAGAAKTAAEKKQRAAHQDVVAGMLQIATQASTAPPAASSEPADEPAI